MPLTSIVYSQAPGEGKWLQVSWFSSWDTPRKARKLFRKFAFDFTFSNGFLLAKKKTLNERLDKNIFNIYCNVWTDYEEMIEKVRSILAFAHRMKHIFQVDLRWIAGRSRSRDAARPDRGHLSAHRSLAASGCPVRAAVWSVLCTPLKSILSAYICLRINIFAILFRLNMFRYCIMLKIQYSTSVYSTINPDKIIENIRGLETRLCIITCISWFFRTITRIRFHLSRRLHFLDYPRHPR